MYASMPFSWASFSFTRASGALAASATFSSAFGPQAVKATIRAANETELHRRSDMRSVPAFLASRPTQQLVGSPNGTAVFGCEPYTKIQRSIIHRYAYCSAVTCAVCLFTAPLPWPPSVFSK